MIVENFSFIKLPIQQNPDSNIFGNTRDRRCCNLEQKKQAGGGTWHSVDAELKPNMLTIPLPLQMLSDPLNSVISFSFLLKQHTWIDT